MDDNLRSALLSLHCALIEFERRAYEKAHGRTASGEFLQALLRDPALAWLAPLTALVARLDELGDGNAAATQRRTWRARVRAMLASQGSDFATNYAERIQLSPDVAFAHAAAMHALAGLKEAGWRSSLSNSASRSRPQPRT
jgi:hypothetical protein